MTPAQFNTNVYPLQLYNCSFIIDMYIFHVHIKVNAVDQDKEGSIETKHTHPPQSLCYLLPRA